MGTPDFNFNFYDATEAAYVQAILDLVRGLALGLDTTVSNPPTGAIRWSATNARWEKYNGTSWAVLASKYAIDVDMLDGLHSGDFALVGHNHAGAYQPLDAELTALAGLVSVANGLPYFSGSGQAALTTLTSFARSILDDADSAAVRATLGLTIGTHVQAFNAALAALSALTTAADKLTYSTAANQFATCDFPDAARTLLAATTAALQRTALQLGSAALATTGAAAGNVPVLDAGGKLVSSIIPAGVGGVDVLSRNEAMFALFEGAIAASKASGSIPSGYRNMFASDELATKTGAIYDAANRAYGNRPITQGVTPTESYAMAGGYTRINRALAIPNNTVVTALGLSSTGAHSGTLYIVERTAANTYIARASVAYAHTASGFEFFTLASAYTIPASGTFYIAECFVSGFNSIVSTLVAGSYLTGALTVGVSTPGVTEYASGSVTMATGYMAAAQNMTLIPAAITAGAAPGTVDVYMLHKAVDSVTLNTDLKARVSRDNGSTWSGYVNLAEVCQYDSNYKLLKGTADMSTTTSGTSLKWEITTLNAKAQQLRAVAMQMY